MALSEELENERRQLKEDEEALMAQMREMDVDHIVERRSAVWLAPHFTCDHLPRHSLVMVLRKECEQIEFARCERNLPRPTRDTTCLHIDRKITDLLP